MMCRLFELYSNETNLKLFIKEFPPLRGAGPQKCLAFSVDGSRFATGGVVSSHLEFDKTLCVYVCVFNVGNFYLYQQ